MEPVTILILDDLLSLSGLVGTRLRSEYAGGGPPVRLLTDEARLKKALDVESPLSTLVMVNVSFVPHGGAGRGELLGIKRIIKRGLLVTWLKSCPVVAYGTLPESELLGSCTGKIFVPKRHYAYVDLRNLGRVRLKSLIDSVSPVRGARALSALICEVCAVELGEYIRSVEHNYFGKMYKLSAEAGRKEFVERLEHLEKLVLASGVDVRVLREAVELIKAFKVGRRASLEKNLTSIRSDLSSLVERLKHRGVANVSP